MKITLPEDATVQDSPYGKLQTHFEQILVRYGLLKEGVEAVADEVGKSMRESATDVARSVRQSTSECVSHGPLASVH